MPCLSFGRYEGIPLTELPEDYLQWLRRKMLESLDDVTAELQARAFANAAAEPRPPAPAEHQTERVILFFLDGRTEEQLVPPSTANAREVGLTERDGRRRIKRVFTRGKEQPRQDAVYFFEVAP